MKMHLQLLLLSLTMLILLPSGTHGATKTWTGGSATSGNWSTLANWQGGNGPVNGDDLVFPANATRFISTNNIDGLSLRSITLGGSNYVLRGNFVALTNGLTASYLNGSSTNDLDIDMGAGQTFSCANAAAALRITGNVTNNGRLLTVSGSGDTTMTGIISGLAGLDKVGSGTLQLAGNSGNTYSGETTVIAGVLELNKLFGDAIAGRLIIGDGSGSDVVRLLQDTVIATMPVTVNSSGLLDLDGQFETIGALTLNGGEVMTGTGTLTLGGNLTAKGGFILGNLSLGGATRTIDVTGEFNLSAVVSGSSGIGFTKTGSGQLRLFGANTYSGLTTVNSGSIFAADPAAFGGSAVGTVLNGGSIEIENVTVANEGLTNDSPTSTLIALANFASGWSGNIVLNASLAVDAQASASLTLSGVMSGSTGITKIGPGTLRLTGANTYAGSTIVSNGTLRVDEAQPLSPVIVTNATLLGSGTVGNITNANDGVIAPGDGLGTGIMTCSNVTFATGSTFSFRLNNATPGSGHDQLRVRGTVDLRGAGVIATYALPGIAGNSFTIIDNDDTDAVVGTFTGLPEGAVLFSGGGGNATLRISYVGGTGNDVVVTADRLRFWDGSSSGNWNTAANWENNVVPVNGDTLVFPSDSPIPRRTATNDIAGLQLDSITILNPGYRLRGNSVTLSNGITADYSSGSADIEFPLQLGAPQSFHAVRGGESAGIAVRGDIANNGHLLTVTGAGYTSLQGVLSGGGGLTKTGTGRLSLLGMNTYTGPTTVTSGTLNVSGSQPESPVTIGAAGRLEGSGMVGNLTNISGGVVDPIRILTCSNATFSGAASDLDIRLSNPSIGLYDQLKANGAVTLGNATLNVTLSFVPASTTSFTIIDNDGTDAVIGTFYGLPEGALLNVGGAVLRISYVGGTGNDVTLTTLPPPLTIPSAQVSAGNGNHAIDVNECNHLTLVLSNTFGSPLTAITVTLSSLTPGVIITQPGSRYPDIPVDGNGTNVTPLQISTLSSFVCGSGIGLDLTVTASGLTFLTQFTIPTAAGCPDGGGACGVCPGVFSGSISNTDLTTRNALIAVAPPSSCEEPKSCPAMFIAEPPLRYDLHGFTNNAPQAACVTVSLTPHCPSSLYSAAFGSLFSESALCSFYLADGGFPISSGSASTYSFSVSPGGAFFVMVSEVPGSSDDGCTNYTLTVRGFECPPPALAIESVPANQVRLFWPTTAGGYVLESTPNLSPDNWTGVNDQPIVNGGSFNVTNAVSGASQFYRLHKP